MPRTVEGLLRQPLTDSRARTALGSLSGGGVSERPKERASKAREGQPSAGSNPAATASLTRPNAGPAAIWAPGVFGCGLKCGLNS